MLDIARSWLGVVVKDLPRYLPVLWSKDARYLALCNRNEQLESAPDGSGYRCDWQWTTDLHTPQVLPSLGARLMRRSLQDHPICLRDVPARNSDSPQVSFIIGHRGDRRLPHLLKTLESIAGQHGVDLECLVVEQDVDARLPGRLPSWVRHVHTPPPSADMPYCRSWAFNVGEKHARGEMLILHDNDLLVSSDYAVRSLAHMRAGFELVNLKRFGFYLSEAHTDAVFAEGSTLTSRAPESIMQNMLGGGSIAIDRQAYRRIGGMDESFIGWGGEDNEFWERAQTLQVWPYGCLPLVHLWHPAQPGKYQADNPTLARHRALAEMPAKARIERLCAMESGAMSGPAGWRGDAALGT